MVVEDALQHSKMLKSKGVLAGSPNVNEVKQRFLGERNGGRGGRRKERRGWRIKGYEDKSWSTGMA